MWHGLKTGAVMVVVVGLVMSALAVARAADEPASDGERIGAEQLIKEALAPLLDAGTLTGEQAEAVVDELAPLVARARFRAGTQQMVRQLGRLMAETAEVLGITAADLREQTESGSTLAEIAAANGFSGEQLVGAVTDHIAAHLAVQVTAGNLDQRQAAGIVARTSETLSNLVDVQHPFGTLLQERRNRALRTAALGRAADALGMSVEEVRTALEDGTSLAEMADAQGVAEDDLIDALLSPVVERIEQALDRGRLTAEAAAEALDKATRRAKEAIERMPGT
jgi:polyhydroxyalkanoate synthesis regulator phasin